MLKLYYRLYLIYILYTVFLCKIIIIFYNSKVNSEYIFKRTIYMLIYGLYHKFLPNHIQIIICLKFLLSIRYLYSNHNHEKYGDQSDATNISFSKAHDAARHYL